VHHAAAAVAAGTNTRPSKHAGNNSRGENSQKVENSENAAKWRDMLKLSSDWCVQTGVNVTRIGCTARQKRFSLRIVSTAFCQW